MDNTPIEVFGRLFTKCTPRCKALPHATRIQAAARATLCRRQYHFRKAIGAEVTMDSTVSTGDTKLISTYVITIHRDGAAWEVEHRYSDWCELDRKLSRHLKQRPALPSRMPLYTSRRLIAHRRIALNGYLREVLKMSSDSALARMLLLDFLSRSHVYWQYMDIVKDWRDRSAHHQNIATSQSPKRLPLPEAGGPKQARRVPKRVNFGEGIKAKVAQFDMSSLSSLPPVTHVGNDGVREGFSVEKIF